MISKLSQYLAQEALNGLFCVLNNVTLLLFSRVSNCDWHIGNNIDYLSPSSPCSQHRAVTFSSLLLLAHPLLLQPFAPVWPTMFCLQSRAAEGKAMRGCGPLEARVSSMSKLPWQPGWNLVRTCFQLLAPTISLYPPLSSISSKSLVRPLRGSALQLNVLFSQLGMSWDSGHTLVEALLQYCGRWWICWHRSLCFPSCTF